jgi:hypothetical protein
MPLLPTPVAGPGRATEALGRKVAEYCSPLFISFSELKLKKSFKILKSMENGIKLGKIQNKFP